MKTKDVLLVVGGVALGYFVFKMNFGKRTASGVVNLATGVVADVKDMAVDTVKMADCEKKLIQQTSTMRFASEEAGAMFRKDFLANCMASK